MRQPVEQEHESIFRYVVNEGGAIGGGCKFVPRGLDGLSASHRATAATIATIVIRPDSV